MSIIGAQRGTKSLADVKQMISTRNIINDKMT